MHFTVKQTGVDSLVMRLQAGMRLQTLMPQWMAEVAQRGAELIKERTPVDTGELRDSITPIVYYDTATIVTPTVYAPYIETGHRMDPRLGEVMRKAGPAAMFLRGMQALRAEMPVHLERLRRRIDGVLGIGGL